MNPLSAIRLNRMLKRYLFPLSLTFCFSISCAQQLPAFWDEIRSFKVQDKHHAPPSDAILFTGSSSIRLWDDLQDMFPGRTIINRGFGGSQLPDLYRYAPAIIYPYHPKQIVIYSGENDIATGTVSAPVVLDRFIKVFRLIRQHLPNVPIVFISIKPAPSRIQYKNIVVAANILIKDFLRKEPRTSFVDVYSSMVDQEGNPKSELFVSDALHMTHTGYEIWQHAIEPFLLK